MVSDQQVKRLWRLAQKLSLEVAAAKAGMDPKTARKYLRARLLPSEMQQKHRWRTRPDPFAEVWDEIEQRLRIDPGLQAKTLFEYLQEQEPGRPNDSSGGGLRTQTRAPLPVRSAHSECCACALAGNHSFLHEAMILLDDVVHVRR
jgi:hypothetical protein